MDIEVISRTQEIFVDSATDSVTVINAGPVGPRGPKGENGEDGDGSALMLHLMDPTPHTAYDDMPSLSSWFANQLA